MKAIINKITWILFGFFAIGIGLYPILYFIMDRKFGLLGGKSSEQLNDIIWNTAFYGHIIFGGLALLVGWLQFSKKLRLKNIGLHRNIGKFYVSVVAISGTCGLYIAYFASGGIIPAVGFFLLDFVWLTSTALAYWHIKNGRIIQHQKMMIYSYAACFGAVTLRLWLPFLENLYDGDFIAAYKVVAYVSWIPNIIVAYFLTRRIKV